MPNYSLSLVVPVFNEEQLLPTFIPRAINELTKVSNDFEIILINDGSTDKSGQIIDELARQYNSLKIINLNKNMGVGVATKVGLKAASKQIIFNNTVDTFFNLEELPRFLEFTNNCDIVSGYRTNIKSNNWYGKILTVGNYYLIRILFWLNFKGFQTVQFIKKDFLDKINIESTTTFVAPEILIKSVKLGGKIKELGTEYLQRTAGKGKCGKLINVIKSLSEILKYWYKWNILKKI